MAPDQVIAGYLMIAIPTAYFGFHELRRKKLFERITSLNIVPIVFLSLALGARWPIVALERVSKYLARLD